MADNDVKKSELSADNKLPDKHLIEQEEAELEKKNKWLYPTVITVLIVFFVVGFIYGLQTVLSMEGAYPEPVLTESKTPPPETNAAMVNYLRDVVDQAKREKPKFARSADFEIGKDDIALDMSVEGSETLKRTLEYLTPDIDSYLDKCVFPEGDGDNDPNGKDYFEGFDDLLNDPAFTADDVQSFTCDYIRYRCISCGNEDTEQLESCEACGSEYPYQMVYRDDYSFCVELKLNDELIDKNLFPMSDDKVRELLAPSLEGIATINKIDRNYKAIKVLFNVNRETNELLGLSYEKDLEVSADADFTGNYAALGNVTISAPLTEKINYSFTWPGLALNTHSMALEPKGKDNLTATLSCDDPTVYDAKWVSSDPNVVQVDEEGYLTAGKQDGGSATITASFDFNGKTYSDSCVVTVKYSVDSMKLNKRHLTLNVNDTDSLVATVSPKKATFKTAKWYTTDDSIVTVDTETGLITAVAPGTATVYALSDDGAYKSSCEVTVK